MLDSAMNIPAVSSPKTRPGDSLGAVIVRWESALREAGHSANTIQAFFADVRLMTRYLGPGRPVGEIGTQDLEEFLRWMEKERGISCSPKTYARRVTSIKAFFRFVREQEACDADPAAALIQRSVLSPLPEILTPEEVERVLLAAREIWKSSESACGKADSRPFVLLALLLQTGIKKGECVALRPQHIDLDSADAPRVFVRYINPRQRFKERNIPLSREWAEAYQQYCTSYPSRDRVFPWSPRRLEYLLEDIGREAGLTKHLSFDMCRWTCAVADIRHGMEADRVREKLGVSRIQWREVGKKIQRLQE
jgi:site-specific recombinase XerD